MGTIKDMLLKTYVKKGASLPGGGKDPYAGKTPPKPIPVKRPRSVGDISIAIQAQQIYNPQAPPAPPMKTPPAKMLEQGTAPAMDMDNSFLGNK